MEPNIISLASQYLTPEILAKIGSSLGLDQSVIGKACSAAIPALFGHFANLAATPEGARKLYRRSYRAEYKYPGQSFQCYRRIGATGLDG